VPRRLLFVEDDENVRLTLSLILQQNGFDVTAVGTVAEALRVISSEPFDLLISDLNLGEQGDGFTIASAMRRVQPNCPTLILTGYPAFEAALAAIRSQVDEFIVKPAEIKTLVETVRRKAEHPEQRPRMWRQSLADFLNDRGDEIVARVLQGMKGHPRLSRLELVDSDRVDHLEGLMAGVVDDLKIGAISPSNEMPVHAAATRHGDLRKRQGYSQIMLVDDIRILDSVIYALVSENLLTIDLSRLISDLGRLNQTLEAELQESLGAFSPEAEAA
jgi:ActR/RegA family two-component response regulator